MCLNLLCRSGPESQIPTRGGIAILLEIRKMCWALPILPKHTPCQNQVFNLFGRCPEYLLGDCRKETTSWFWSFQTLENMFRVRETMNTNMFQTFPAIFQINPCVEHVTYNPRPPPPVPEAPVSPRRTFPCNPVAPVGPRLVNHKTHTRSIRDHTKKYVFGTCLRVLKNVEDTFRVLNVPKLFNNIPNTCFNNSRQCPNYSLVCGV
jgi:hypothetical protein